MAGVSVSNHTTNIQNLGNLTIEYNPTTNVSFDWVYARSSPLFFTEPYAVSCTDLSATQVLCNISTTTNLTGYQVRIPYTNVNDTNLTVELAEEVLNEAPTLQFIAIDPTTLYKNMTIACAVNWTHPSNSTFTVYQGLTRNGTIVDSFNQTYDNYPNGTIWNYTAYPLSVEFTHGDKLACWSRANSTDANSTYNYTVNYTIGNWAPIISNVQITSPLQNGSNATGSADFTDVEGDVINCRFEWFRNGTSIWNSSQTPCTNTSTLNALNYTVGDLINFTVYANDSYGGNATPVSSATITVSPAFTWNNYTYTASQYESVAYSYTLNFSLPAGDENGTAQLEYNGINLTASCTNVSVTYYCTLSSIQAPLVSTNGTAKNGNWFVSYDSLTAGATTVNKSFTQTVYYGAWATGINSSTIVAGGGPATVNVMYGNTAGITATLSGTAWLLGTSNSGSLTCVAGICSGTITTPSVSSAMLYQVEANITLTSSYWGTTQNRVVRIEATHYFTASNSTNTSSGTVTNPSNGWDLSWTTYATFSSGGAEYFNYTLSQLYNGNFTMKDSGGMRYYAIPSDCLRPVVSLRAQRPGATVLVNYSCYNYSSETYSTIYTTAVLGSALFYEQNMTLWQNNSLVKVVPFGLTTCTVGTPLLYYSCWDETTRGSLTCNYAQTFILNTTSGNLIQSFNGTGASAWTICFYPSTLVGNLSSTEEITATGYDNRFFYILGTAFNSSVTFNETRWAGPTATTKLTFVYVKRAGVGEAGVYVYVQRLFVANSTFRTVGMGKTNDDGTAVVYLEPNDAFYKFVVVDSTGTVLYTSTTQQVGCASTAASCSVTLNIESSVVDFWDYQDGISSACTFSDTTKIYSCSFTVASGVSKYFQLDCYKWAQFGNKTLNCSESTSTASGTLFCDLGDASTTGTYVCYLQSYSTGLILQEDTFNWMAVASWGTTGLFIALILVAVMAWVGTNFGPSMTILLAYVGFAVSWLFQFVNVDLLAMVGLGVVAGAMIYVIKH